MTYKLCWVTDIHFDHLQEVRPAGGGVGPRTILSESKVKSFCDQIMKHSPDGLVVTGDISTAEFIETHLMWLETYCPGIPIYFILGNHDFFHGSIREVRYQMKKYDGTKTRTQWLNVSGVVKLTEKTALVGHDGWYDGGYSDWFKSKLIMNDYHWISELKFLPPQLLFNEIRTLSKESADHILLHVQEAAKTFKYVFFASHVPPFRDNSRAPDRSLSDKDWLPNMASKMAGDALLVAAKAYPGTEFISLSGHTHTAWEQDYAPNLKAITGNAQYGSPARSIRFFDLE